MNYKFNKILWFAVISINLIFAACGGGGGDTANATADYLTINETKYAADNSAVHVGGFVDQTNPYNYQYGGPAAVISMNDTQSGNWLGLNFLSTINGWIGTYYLSGASGVNRAYAKDKAVATGGVMWDGANGSGTGGPINISSFGGVGQSITGSFNVNLCDSSAVCSASIKNYTGSFSITRSANLGSLVRPVNLIAQALPVTNTHSIHPATGKNYYTISTNVTGGTLTITLTPVYYGDVNMEVFTDAGFTSHAICNVTSILNVTGNGAETCTITVTPNQKIYVAVSQTLAAIGAETYTFKVVE